MPDLTPKQLKEIDQMNEILAGTQMQETPDSNKSFAGSVDSKMDKFNTAESVAALDAPTPAITVEDVEQSLFKETPATEEVKTDDYNPIKTVPWETKEPEGPENPIPLRSKSQLANEELQRQIAEQNKQNKIAAYSEIEKLYYDELDEVSFQAKEDFKEQIQDIESNLNSYDTFTYQAQFYEGGGERTKKIMKPEAKAEINRLRAEYQKVVEPVNREYLGMVNSRIEGLNDMRAKYEAKNPDGSQNENFSPKDLKYLDMATRFQERAKRRIEDNLSGAGGWGAMLSEAQDPGFYTVGLSSAEESLAMLGVVLQTELGYEPSETQIALFDAINTQNEVQTQVDTKESHTVLTNVMQTIPWMAQMAATSGIGGVVEKGTRTAVYKGVQKYTGNILKKGVKASTVKAINKGAAKGAGYLTGVAAQVSVMPSTSADFADRYVGEVEIERDAEGNFVKMYARDDLYQKLIAEGAEAKKLIIRSHDSYTLDGKMTPEAQAELEKIDRMAEHVKPVGGLEAGYKAVTNAALELFTEKIVGGQVTKIMAKTGFKDPLDVLPPGKLSDYVERLKKTFGYNGLIPEMLEEEAMIPMNALLVGDSQYSDLWDGHQQRELFLQVATTGALMGGFGGVVNLPSRLANQQYYKDRREMLKKFRELKESDPSDISNIIDLASNASDITTMVGSIEKLREEGEHKKADVLAEKIMYNQMLKAFDTHTIDDFENALKSLSESTTIDQTTRNNIASAQADIAAMKSVYETHSEKKNIKTIMRLEANKLLAKKAQMELTNQANSISEDVQADIEAFAERKKFKVPEWIDLNQIYDNSYEESLSKEQLVEYNQFLDTLNNEGIASVGAMNRIQMAKNEAIKFGRDNRVLFNEQTANNYQRLLAEESHLNQELSRNQALIKAIEENDEVNYNKEFDKTVREAKGSLSQNKVNDIKDQLDKRVAKSKARQELKKQRDIQAKADAIAEEQRKEGKQNPETKEIEAQIKEKKGEVNAAKAEENSETVKRDKQFNEIADGMETMFTIGNDGMGYPPENKTSEEEGLPFDAPLEIDPNLPEEKKNNIAKMVKGMYDLVAQELGHKPTFKDVMTKLANKKGQKQAEEYYNVMALGWKENGYAQTDFKKEYDKIFDPFNALADELMSDPSVFDTDMTREEAREEDKKAADKVDEKSNPVVDHTETGDPVRGPGRELKTVTSDLKLGFLAINFKTNEKGEKVDSSSELNEDSLVDFHRLLDPDKFNAGTPLSVAIPGENVLANSFVILLDKKGTPRSVKYLDWITPKIQANPKFKETDEYISTVPIFSYDSTGTPVAQIHSVSWYNADNIGFSNNPPLQNNVIQKGRREVMDLRTQIIKNGLSVVEIHSKEGMTYHSIPKGAPLMTLEEANPDSVVSIAMDRGKLKIGEDYFENEKRVIIGDKKLKQGYVYDLRRIGVNEKGQETWFPFEVFKQDEVRENKITDSDLNTVKWALAAHIKLINFPSYLQEKKKDIENGIRKDPAIMGITPEKAQKIADRILKETGYDITVKADLRQFMRQYIKISDVQYHSLSESLFSADTQATREQWKVHTANEALGTNANMVEIDANGEITNLNKTYTQHLKQYFKTEVKSFNVGTEENPVWATAIQPKIRFGYKKKDDNSIIEVPETLEVNPNEEVKEVKPKSAAARGRAFLEENGFIDSETAFDAPVQLTDTTKVEGVFNTTPGVTIQQEGTIVDFLFNEIAKAVGISGGSKTDKQQLQKDLKDKYNNFIRERRTATAAILAEVEAEYKAGDKSNETLDTIKELEAAMEVYSNISKNWENIEAKAFAKVKKYTKITDNTLEDDRNMSMREKDYSKSSLEEDNKNKSSYRLRRFFAGISERTGDGAVKKGFLGLPTYVGFNEVYDSVAQILSSPVETESNFDAMMEKLNKAESSHKWLPDLINKLESADEQMKKEFVYNYTKHSLSMKFAMYNRTAGGYTLKMYDTNSHEITRLIRKTWANNFKITPLVTTIDGEYAIDKTKAENLLDEVNSWGEEGANVTPGVAQAWLKQFGITLSDDAFKELMGGMYYQREYISYPEMFNSKRGIFRLLKDYLEEVKDKKDTRFEENERNHPHGNIGGVLKALANLEGKYTNQAMTLSFRDSGKSIFGLTPNKYATDRILELKQFDQDGNNELVDKLRKLSMTHNSFVLDLLENEPEFRDKFGVDHIGITSLKELGEGDSPFSSITDLSDIDHDLTKMAGLQDLKQGEVKSTVDKNGNIQKGGNGIGMRIGRMFLPTMSDKSQMLLLNTGVFNFFRDRKKSFEVSSTGEVGFTETLKNLLFNQLVKTELDRITKFHSKIGSTNITGYNLGAQIFQFLPALNNIKDKGGIRMIELMKTRPDIYTSEKITELFRPQIDAVLQQIVEEKVAAKKLLWEKNVDRDNKGNIKSVKFFDKKYLSQGVGSMNEKFEIAMYDFVLNSFLANSNMFTLLAGDPALYSQDKNFSKFDVDNMAIQEMAVAYGKAELFELYPNYKEFLNALNELEKTNQITEKMANDMRTNIKPNIFSGSDAAYIDLAKKTGVNLGKRLALLIAPGNKIADSKNDKYMQIFLQDATHISENSDYLIKLYYGEKALADVQGDLDLYKSTNKESVKRDIREKLAEKFPDLSDYFDIESTDAQEYSTVEEHLNILERQGRIPDAKLVEIKEALAEGKDLTPELMKFVLQPIKPVYTGQVIEEDQDVARTVYIKSSSFPLLPQMTKGRGLDALRVKLEELEKLGMPVRASYQSANKVGSMNNPIDPFNAESLEKAQESSLILDRNNFRIQQDVPFKSDKNKEDKVSMGTQIFKLLFGDGMMDQEGFMIGDKEYTGKKLYEHFNETFSDIIKIKKKALYRELGLNEAGIPIDEYQSIQKIQKLLQDEAIGRGYPRQDVEGLTFVEKKDVNDQTYYDFNLPLWLSANSNRYESLLNSIVTNRLIKQKMPGSSFVLGSEEGMNVTESKEGIKQSRVINIGNYKGGELKGVQDKDGNFTYAEIMVPSKFKNSQGELINLFEKRRGGRGYTYLNETKDGFTLKLDMIAPELLTNFTFRTPTSAHVSASIVKIAAILPPENGDLMIVPKNFTKQKGLDFDVDKETAYQLWSVRENTGKIKPINESHKEAAIKKLRDNPSNMEEGTPTASLLAAIFKEEYTNIIDDATLNDSQKIDALADKFDQKILENEFIRIHKAVYANPNPEVQKKINKVLSMEFASKQADFIEELTVEGTDESGFTILSDEYQKEKMGLGAAGKLAIGVYSNYVTFHSLTQQLGEDQALSLMEETVDEQGRIAYTPKSFRIGNFVSDGKLGRLKALGNKPRSISEVLAEKQNTATDNEKEQILGRVNVNGTTINVDALLTLLGFDKGETVGSQETSIPYLFLSQPILKDYVKMLQESQAITSEFDYNAEEKIIQELNKKYSEGYVPEEGLEDVEEFTRLTREMTSENLVNEISSSTDKTPGLQIAVLKQFLELNEYARDLSGTQGVVNTTSLGKSIIESNDKYSKLERFPANKRIKNVEKLIGDYILIQDVTQKPEGYFKVGKYYVKPTTPQGQIVVNGIVTGNQLWNEYFPYSDTSVQKVMDEIIEISNAENKSDNKKIELKYEIFREIKKYMNSNNNNGIFDEKASVEREALFIDSEGNTSLATYLNELVNTPGRTLDKKYKKGAYNVKHNKLISRFQYNLNSNGEPSTIRYNNSASESFDEDYLYNSIAEMVINNETLPEKNGKPYTSRMLAADLVAQAYLEGGVQEVIQYVKYVPVEYLDSIGFNNQMQMYSPKRNSNIFHTSLGIAEPSEDTDHKTHTFVKQYIQHNPTKARNANNRMYFEEFKNKTFGPKVDGKKGVLESFTYTSKSDSPKFLVRREDTKSKRKQDQFSLFQHVGGGKYQRISVLGAYGMNEYELGNPNMHSLLDKALPEKIDERENKKVNGNDFSQSVDIFKIEEGNATNILNRIKGHRSSSYKHFPKLVDFLLPSVKANLKVRVEDTSKGGTQAQANGRTFANKETGEITIVIDQELMDSNNHDMIAKVFMHEFVHSVTINELRQYFNDKGEPLSDEKLPAHVSRLMRVFKATQRQFGSELDELIAKRRDHLKGELPSGTGYSKKELNEVYAATSIFEFVTVALTEPDFQKRMEEVKFRASGQTLWHKFRVAVMNILQANDVKAKPDTITFEALSSIMEFIDVEADSQLNNNSLGTYPKINRYTRKEQLLGEELSEGVNVEDDVAKKINNDLSSYDLPTTIENSNAINNIFEQNPELQKIGSPSEYSKFLASTGGEIRTDIEGFKNYKEGMSAEVIDTLPNICN